MLISTPIHTPLGPMVAITDQDALHLLAFTDRPNIDQQIKQLVRKTKSAITAGATPISHLLEHELKLYFAGTLQQFQTPIVLHGTLFQNQVWLQLQKIPFGYTWSYGELAHAMEKPSAHRAAAQANGANCIAILVPCHRVIYANGQLGGYNDGLLRKQWLMSHERLDKKEQ